MDLKNMLAAGLIGPAIGAGSVGAVDLQNRAMLEGDIVSVSESSLTIELNSEHERAQKVYERHDLQAGDHVTILIGENTHMQEDLASGQHVFAGGQMIDGQLEARMVLDHAPKRLFHKSKHKNGEQPRVRPVGKVVSIDVDANIITVEHKDGSQNEISYTDEVKFIQHGEEVSETDVHVDDILALHGHRNENGDKKLLSIHILEPKN